MGEDERTLLRIDREWNEAYTRRDAAALERIKADDRRRIDGAGRRISKAPLLERAAPGPDANGRSNAGRARLRTLNTSAGGRMISKAAALVLCLVVSPWAAVAPRVPRPEAEAHGLWLRRRYEEATSIKVGMTRAELKKLFTEDGGVQSFSRPRYVLKSSPMIKVDVEFELPEGASPRRAQDDSARIKNISKPYLEPMYLD